MHIILVSDRLATAKSMVLTARMMALAAAFFAALLFSAALLLSWVGVQFRLPFAESLALSVQQQQAQKSQEFVRDNVNVMAVKLGQLQAQLLRLDSLGERISALSGVDAPARLEPGKMPPPAAGKAPPGQGGPLILPASPVPLSAEQLQQEVDRLAQLVDQRSDSLAALESQLMDKRVKSIMLPTILPIQSNTIGSGFGWRTDPIAGVQAMHEGIDFIAETGTRVIAAAGGVVLSAEFHPQYGNLIEIDHGNGFSSRYAHLSRALVRSGQVIKRGQEIAASGNTGRSTGPHLHFEVRYKGVPQNPVRFLRQDLLMAQTQTAAGNSAKAGAPR
ncbi:M23 family metallopeptidase [Rhodocyclus tenuis]|uniref:M23 family metallopeptidase n=1 Tax=Rhodocyclus tenuis TaxID=1066 RepID=UPI0019061194|nr:M23 family metallopeptidase [Rhodocyclus tenuis]MBK1680815.1 peptidase M23 [Rhodocyclus tenuis]